MTEAPDGNPRARKIASRSAWSVTRSISVAISVTPCPAGFHVPDANLDDFTAICIEEPAAVDSAKHAQCRRTKSECHDEISGDWTWINGQAQDPLPQAPRSDRNPGLRPEG